MPSSSSSPKDVDRSLLVEKRDANTEASDAGASLPQLPVLLNTSREPPRSVVYLDETLYGARAVVVRSVLTAEECAACIEYMKGRDMVPAHSRTDYRNNLRILVSSHEFATEVYQRLKATLMELHEHEKDITKENADDFPDNGLGMLGTWGAEHLNDCFRMCCYHPGGHFAPHYDADYVVEAVSYRSFKTMMIYLNDEYVGGETNFLSEHSLHWDEERKLYCAPTETIVASFKACPGDVLLFDHKILHEGAQVTSGMKWMMRSEIMYRKVPSTSNEGIDSTLAQALQILQAAKNAEGSGDMTLAVSLYSKAFKLYPELERHA
jgi:hypothetical protein